MRPTSYEANLLISRETLAKPVRAQGTAGISPRTWHPPDTIHGNRHSPTSPT